MAVAKAAPEVSSRPMAVAAPAYEIRECRSPQCRFRFPVAGAELGTPACPRCGGLLRVAAAGTLARACAGMRAGPSASHVGALLDNIRSIYNTGSIFRSADGAGIGHLYLCGMTATPQHPKLAKTALGAQEWASWSYHPNALDVARQLAAEGVALWALEDTGDSCSLFTCAPPITPTVIIVGNEVIGVDPGLLDVCEQHVTIPMHGLKRSLNVATAFGIAAYWLAYRRELPVAAAPH